jgi:hypothetical protein
MPIFFLTHAIDRMVPTIASRRKARNGSSNGADDRFPAEGAKREFDSKAQGNLLSF